jgi:predicted 3-demethylubiquinone-9 3-methyltransferase (glyoxalase superfamily)
MSAEAPGLSVCLWFDGEAEAAALHYLDAFGEAAPPRISRPRADAPAFSVAFTLRGRAFVALNGGPQYKFTPAISLVVDCADQAEVDHFWAHLGEGGAPGRCGWLVDKFGVSWQVVPRALPALLSRGPAVMKAMLTMNRLDIAALQWAGDAGGKP